MRKSLAYVSLAVMSAFAALSPAHSDGRFWLVGEPTKGEPTTLPATLRHTDRQPLLTQSGRSRMSALKVSN
jgi:hypothetical protein